MVVVFDLDNTLYDELTFAYGGFRAVASFLSPLLGESQGSIFEELKELLTIQREFVFDRFLQKRGVASQRLVLRCLSLYRCHEPHLNLYPEAKECLKRLKGIPLYVITDGNKSVQRRKCQALMFDTKVKKCLCTHAYGIIHAKPSPYCLLKICEWEKVSPKDVIMVGDNPHKDFVGIKPLGFQTVRVLTGPFKDVKVSKEYEADIIIPSLAQFRLS